MKTYIKPEVEVVSFISEVITTDDDDVSMGGGVIPSLDWGALGQ